MVKTDDDDIDADDDGILSTNILEKIDDEIANITTIKWFLLLYTIIFIIAFCILLYLIISIISQKCKKRGKYVIHE